MRLTSTFLFAALLAWSDSNTYGATIYAENFNQAVTAASGTKSGTSLTSAGNTTGWLGWFEQSNGDNVVQPTTTENSYDSIRLADANGFDGARSYILAQDASSNPDSEFMLFTEEYPIDRAVHDVTAVTWRAKNNDSRSEMRVVVRIAGHWFANDPAFTHTAGSGTWALNTFNFSTAGSAWRDMTFTTGTGGDIIVGSALTGDLPSGTIDAFGLYVRTGYSNTTAAMRVDDFAIEASPAAVPEPAAGASLLIALAVVAGARWRRR